MKASAKFVTRKQISFQEKREKFWCDNYIAFVQGGRNLAVRSASEWADGALEKYDQRFNPSKNEKN